MARWWEDKLWGGRDRDRERDVGERAGSRDERGDRWTGEALRDRDWPGGNRERVREATRRGMDPLDTGRATPGRPTGERPRAGAGGEGSEGVGGWRSEDQSWRGGGWREEDPGRGERAMRGERGEGRGWRSGEERGRGRGERGGRDERTWRSSEHGEGSWYGEVPGSRWRPEDERTGGRDWRGGQGERGGEGEHSGWVVENRGWRSEDAGEQGWQGRREQGDFGRRGGGAQDEFGSGFGGGRRAGWLGAERDEQGSERAGSRGGFESGGGQRSTKYEMHGEAPGSYGPEGRYAPNAPPRYPDQRAWAFGDARRTELNRPGRAPKGYKRSDQRIRDDVYERITESQVNAEEVDVQVQNGEVTLTGHVASRWDKRSLADIAEDVFGVTHVRNDLRVQREGAPTAAPRADDRTLGAERRPSEEHKAKTPSATDEHGTGTAATGEHGLGANAGTQRH